MTAETFYIIGSILGITSFVLNWAFMVQGTKTDNYLFKKIQECEGDNKILKSEINALRKKIEELQRKSK